VVLRRRLPAPYDRCVDFELTPEMIDKIAFAMEDQDEQYAIDVTTGELAPLAEVDGQEDRYVPLPRWGPAEGFHLMQSFVSTLRNPVYRDLLSQSLAAGKGVFRQFKDTLKRNREVERLWFHYKDRRLRSVVVAWYNASREARGLERLPPEPEETEELVASDFTLAWGERSHADDVLRLDHEAFLELFPHDEMDRLEERYRARRAGLPAPSDPSSALLVAETPTGELVGFAWGIMEGSDVHLAQLTVVRELRGIGLGEAILRRFLSDLRVRGAHTLTTELEGKSLRFSQFFQALGFRQRSEVLACSLDSLGF
jgi:ribosomal protein S18 acetylase RimI-like enzyme